MEKVREIIRLKQQCGLSERTISRALSVSRPVVSEYISKIAVDDLDYAQIKEMDDDTLLEVLQAGKASNNQRYIALSEQFEYFAKELKRPGVNLLCLWQEYRAEHPDGYSYSQFCYHFQVWKNTSTLTMHLCHKAGDKMFVDFAGKKLQIADKKTGEIKDVEVFVAVLGASRYTYVQATTSQKKEDFIGASQNAFNYFGGVPAAVVPDCLKAAVQTPNKYEPELNRQYADFARHFQTTILPARPHHPKDKALVEGAVRIVYQWIYTALRNHIFSSLDELNSAIRQQLEVYNNKPMQKLKTSRRQLFEDIEKAALRALPHESYMIRYFKTLKAHFNYHIYLSDDKHYYSVPYRYRAKQLLVIYTDRTVEIFHKNRRIAFHKRNRTSNGYSTTAEHMPSQHRMMSDWNPQRLTSWAKNIGEYTEAVIAHILRMRQHPEQAYKVCLGILNLEKKFGRERLNKACQRATQYNLYSYKCIKNMLLNRVETHQQDIFEPSPTHDNIRGNQYYQTGGYHDKRSHNG